jgi:hypothetical protein
MFFYRHSVYGGCLKNGAQAAFIYRRRFPNSQHPKTFAHNLNKEKVS